MESFTLPSRTLNTDGNMRRVGFELEFTGMTLAQASDVLRQTFAGSTEEISVAEHKISVKNLGIFTLELDWGLLKKEASHADENDSKAKILEWLSEKAALVVPLEVVCPPIPIDQLSQLDSLVNALRQAGALGTKDSFLAAYGVHINPELPDLKPNTIHTYLRAFALLQDWLEEQHAVDLTRKITPYIDLFPEAYIDVLLQEALPVTSYELIFAHYLEHNATRNRALDLLPLLKYIDESSINTFLPHEKIGKRPTFHYRLPNSLIDQPEWNFARSWNLWCVVEALAAQPDALRELAEAYQQACLPLLGVRKKPWTEFVSQWLVDQQLV